MINILRQVYIVRAWFPNVGLDTFLLVPLESTAGDDVSLSTILLIEQLCNDDDLSMIRNSVNNMDMRRKERETPCRVVDFIEVTILSYSDVVFRTHFRMCQATAEVGSANFKLVHSHYW